MSTPTLVPAGVRNGRLPLTLLSPLPWSLGDSLLAPAAFALIRLNAAFRLRFGVNMTINDSYRDLDRQQAYWDNPPSGVGTAARPGTSNHGWGLAVDLGYLGGFSGERYLWMRQNGPGHGWNHPSWARDGNPANGAQEPWHWEFTGAPYVIPENVTPREDEDMPLDATDLEKVKAVMKSAMAERDLEIVSRETEYGRNAGNNLLALQQVQAHRLLTWALERSTPTARQVNDMVNLLIREPSVSEVAEAVAALLPTLVSQPAALSALSDADVARIAKAAADERDARERARLNP